MPRRSRGISPPEQFGENDMQTITPFLWFDNNLESAENDQA